MHASVLCLAAATDHRIILNSFSLQFPTFCTPKKSFLRQPASQPACTTIRTAVSSNTHTHTLTCLMNVCMHLAVMMAILVGFPSFRIFSFVPSFFPFFYEKNPPPASQSAICTYSTPTHAAQILDSIIPIEQATSWFTGIKRRRAVR